jgi:cell wall-associated NlpC family hydrolase
MSRSEQGSVFRWVLIAGAIFLAMTMGLVLVIGFAAFSAQKAAASPNATGNCDSISINPDDVNAAVNNPALQFKGFGIYQAPPKAIEAYVCAQALIHDRLKDQPRIKDCKIRWQLLAAIGSYESSNGKGGANNVAPYIEDNGDLMTPIIDGIAHYMGMQTTTWAGVVKYNPDANGGGANQDNVYDASLGAALHLCDLGVGTNDFSSPSSSSYDDVMFLLKKYCMPATPEACPYDLTGRVELLKILDANDIKIRYSLAAVTTAATGPGTGTAANCQPQDSLPAQVVTAIKFACDQLGEPYVYAAMGPDAWDCSGLVTAAYAAAGVSIPRTSETEYQVGVHVEPADLRPGDLVFFTGADAPPGHVGMYLGSDQFIEAPHTGDVVKIATYSSYGSGLTNPATGGPWGGQRIVTGGTLT